MPILIETEYILYQQTYVWFALMSTGYNVW